MLQCNGKSGRCNREVEPKRLPDRNHYECEACGETWDTDLDSTMDSSGQPFAQVERRDCTCPKKWRRAHAPEDDELDKEAEELLRKANYPGDLEKYFAVLREHGLTMKLAGTWRDNSRGIHERWEFSGGSSERPTKVIVRFWHDTRTLDWQGILYSGKEIKEQSSGQTLRKLNLYLERWTGKG